jgi:hypothetical protein
MAPFLIDSIERVLFEKKAQTPGKGLPAYAAAKEYHTPHSFIAEYLEVGRTVVSAKFWEGKVIPEREEINISLFGHRP